MARPKGSGINTVTKRKADGTTTSYFYDRASGAFLGHDRAAAEKRIKQDADRVPKALDPQDRSLSAIITLYKTTAKFKKLQPSTKATYTRDLDWMRQHYGDLPVRGFRESSIERIKLSLQDQPRKANKTLAMFSIVLGLAKKLDWIPANPALRAERIETQPRSEIWSREDEARFMDGARWELQLAMLLLLYTVQRPADMLSMTLGNLSERQGRLWISLRQRKTQELVDVPVHVRLEPLLRERMARKIGRKVRGAETVTTLLVPSPRGLAWAYRNFARAWDAQQRVANLRFARILLGQGREKAEVRTTLAEQHRQRRDMRRTGVVRLAEAGATTPQIAAISGHKIDYCQSIIDTYLPRRSEVALGGIEAWERQGDEARVISIATRRR